MKVKTLLTTLPIIALSLTSISLIATPVDAVVVRRGWGGWHIYYNKAETKAITEGPSSTSEFIVATACGLIPYTPLRLACGGYYAAFKDRILETANVAVSKGACLEIFNREIPYRATEIKLHDGKPYCT